MASINLNALLHFNHNIPYSRAQFSLIRILFGGCLIGTLGQGLKSYILSSDLSLISTLVSFQVVGLIIAMILTINLTIGWHRRWMGLGLFGLLTITLSVTKAFTINPFIIWLTLSMALPPSHEYWTIQPKSIPKAWHFPGFLFWGGWLLTASVALLNSHTLIVTSGLFDRPNPLHQLILLYAIVGLQFLCGIGALFNRTRHLAWIGLLFSTILQLFTPLPPISLYQHILMPLLLIDPRWFKPKQDPSSPPILFFDSECVVCHNTVKFILAAEPEPIHAFSSLQSAFAQEKLASINPPDSIVYYKNDTFHIQSNATREIARDLGGIWRILGELITLCPQKIRDSLYDRFARNRYAIFGKITHCELPSEAQKKRFIQ